MSQLTAKCLKQKYAFQNISVDCRQKLLSIVIVIGIFVSNSLFCVDHVSAVWNTYILPDTYQISVDQVYYFSLFILYCAEHTGQFINNKHAHRHIYVTPFVLLDSLAVREFLCLDDPPGPFDSLEESRVSVHIHVEVCVLYVLCLCLCFNPCHVKAF